jgi:hypothetical protein
VTPKKRPPAPPTGEIVLYRTEDGRTRVECRFIDETRWQSQALVAELLRCSLAQLFGNSE